MQDINVDVVHGKVDEHVYGFHRASSFNYLPIQVKPVWIQNAQPSAVILESHTRKYFFEKYGVAITMMKMHVRSMSNQLTKACYFVAIQINEVILAERGMYF